MKKLFAAVTVLAGLAVAGPAFAGDVEIHDAWSKASLGKVPNGVAFLTIENGGDADRVVDVTSDLAARTELHTHIMENNVMMMRPVEGGIDVPAHGAVMFEPGSYHVMLIGLKKPLQKGETVNVTLHFEKAGDVVVPVTVMDALATGPHGKDGAHGNAMPMGDEHKGH